MHNILNDMSIKEQTYELIDALKLACTADGLGNDGNEYKIITQVFLYKFLNDKFGYEIKKISPKLRSVNLISPFSFLIHPIE